jgi:hypothetical protein
MTIEEQIQKADAVETESESDELDDIDKVRDDLQSTKQMLALELRNKEAMERENKKLLVDIKIYLLCVNTGGWEMACFRASNACCCS